MTQRTQNDFPKVGATKKNENYVKGGSMAGEPRGLFPKELTTFPTNGKAGTPGSAPTKSTADPKISGRVKK